MPILNITYNENVPVATNDPGVDQPKLTENTNSTSQLISQDHIGFGTDGSGFHKYLHLFRQLTVPEGFTNYGSFYTKNDSGINLFFSNSDTLNEYKLTKVDNTNFSTFGLMTAYSNGTTGEFGWTFLPGGIRVLYGLTNINAVSTTVIFPIPFSTVFVVLPIYLSVATNREWRLAQFNNTDFTLTLSNTFPVGSQISWMAIGL
jgi:hypothetical protein